MPNWRVNGAAPSLLLRRLLAAMGTLVTVHLPAAALTNAIIGVPSASLQFYAQGVPVPSQPFVPSVPIESLKLRLDPSLVVVSCERIKQAFLRELDLPDHWRSQIHLSIEFTTQTNRPVDIQPQFVGGAWRYRVVLPDEIEARKFVQAMVHVLLLELVNRHNTPHFTEIPLWLPEGLTRHLLTLVGPDLVLQPFSYTLREERNRDPLAVVRDYLRSHPALTFNQLAMPTPDLLRGDSWQTFQACSQLFVAELLRMNDGRQALHDLLAELPRYLNWQVAFLAAYQSHFRTLLEVEKWWALVVAAAQSQEQFQGWTREASWQKLDEILHIPAQVRQTTNSLPVSTDLDLQQFIERWDFDTQQAVLRGKINQLRLLRYSAVPDVTAAINEYLAVLELYLQQRSQAGYAEIKDIIPDRPYYIARGAIRKLNALDAQRESRLNRLNVTAKP